MFGETEGHQNNSMVSRNQSPNSEVFGRGMRNVQPNRLYNSGDFDTNNSEGEIMHRATTTRQRGAQVRGGARGGRGRRANVGNDRNTRANSDLRDSDNPINNNANQHISVNSDESDTEDEDRQIVEVSESVKEVKEHMERNEVYTNTFLLALLRALPPSVVDILKQDARENKDAENYTYVHNNLATLEPRNPSYAEVVEPRANATNNGTSSDNASNGARSDNANAGTITPDEVREILRQEAPRIINDRIEDSRRKKNIIILGMIEGYDERLQVEDMLEALGCRGTISAISGRPIRLGAIRRGRNRPIKVEFNDEQAVDYIIEKKWELRYTDDFYNLFINRDLCKYDREKEKETRRQNRASRTSRASESNPRGGRGGVERGGRPDSQNHNENENGVANRNENVVTQDLRETNEPIERENQNQTTEDQAENQNTQGIQQNLPTPGNVQRSEVRTEGEEGGVWVTTRREKVGKEQI